MDNTPHQIKELIIKFLQKEASDQELGVLKKWLEEDNSHQKYFDEINDTFQTTVTMSRITLEKIDHAWHNIYQRITPLGDSHRNITIINRSHYNFLRIAAVVSALIITGYITWQYFSISTVLSDKNYIVRNSKRMNTRVDLPDGTIVWLNANSILEYPADFSSQTREVSLKGEAFFDVKKDSKSFVVKTENLAIYVKGTRFNVRAYEEEDDIKTTLEEGKVELLVKGQNDVLIMKPGDQVTFNASQKKITRHTVDPSDYTSWKEERLVFDDTPLCDIILKLENRYKVRIMVDEAIADRERLTMTIQHETIDEVLEFIRLSSRLKYRKEKDRIFIYE